MNILQDNETALARKINQFEQDLDRARSYVENLKAMQPELTAEEIEDEYYAYLHRITFKDPAN